MRSLGLTSKPGVSWAFQVREPPTYAFPLSEALASLVHARLRLGLVEMPDGNAFQTCV